MHSRNVLVISSEFPPGPGGIGNHAYNMVKALANLEYNVTVMTNFGNASSVESQKFDEQHHFEVVRICRHNLVFYTYIKRILALISILKNNDLEVCICTGKFSLWMSGIVKIFASDAKLIAVVHGSEANFKKGFSHYLTKRSLNKMTHIIAVSNFTKSLLKRFVVKEIDVIPNGIDENFTTLITQKNPLDKENLRLLTVGNVTERKGQQNVITALPVLKIEYTNLVYNIVGLPTQRNKLENTAEALGVAKFIKFHGKVDHDTLLDIYSKNDIFIMLSQNIAGGEVEGFGISILEANSFGLPAIGSNNCGIEDAIDHRKTGILVNPKNAEEIRCAINEIAENYAWYSQNAIEWAANHNWSNIIRSYHNLIIKPI